MSFSSYSPRSEVPLAPEIGSFLEHYAELGIAQTVRIISNATRIARPEFLVSSPADRNEARFAHTMEDENFRSYYVDQLRLFEMPDVTVLGSDGILLYRGAVICDSMRHIMYWHPDSVTESFESTAKLRLKAQLLVQRVHLPGRFMVGFSGSWRNYAHWLQETLPKLVVFARYFASHPDVKLVLPAFAPGSFQQKTLELLDIPAEAIVIIQSGEALHFERLLVLGDTDLWSVPPFVYEAAQFLADRAAAALGGPPARYRRLFIHRESGLRRMTNFTDLRQIILRHGYEIVVPDGMSMADQIMAMLSATHVAAEHGAGLANVLFCKPGGRVLELFNPACVQPAFWSVAGAAGAAFGYLVGSHVPTPERPVLDWNSSYSIAPGALDAALSAFD